MPRREAQTEGEKQSSIGTKRPPLETFELRRGLTAFLATRVRHPDSGKEVGLGSCRFGIYAFYDYDNEPIYVGQTDERVSTRIRRHLTNWRTDAVAMSVLDPFEVRTIEVWPLKEGADLDAAESTVYRNLVKQSRFHAVLNEKPPRASRNVPLPKSHRAEILGDEVIALRGHPDTRIARRAATIARLAQLVNERKTSHGLRRALLVQARRLEWLAHERLKAIGEYEEGVDDLEE